jgi:DNA polymerase-3 subunit delta
VKNDKAAGEALGMHPFIAKDFIRYAHNYPMPKLVKIFQHLEQADLRAKGLDTTGISGGEILQELMFKILH